MTHARLIMLLASPLALACAGAWAQDPCPARTYPIPQAECAAPVWASAVDGVVVARHWRYRDRKADCGEMEISEGHAVLREVTDPYPVVDQTLFAVSALPDAVYVQDHGGCVVSRFAVGWLEPEQISAGIASIAHQATVACAREIEYGALTGRSDAADICASAAGAMAAERLGATLADPPQVDALRWCAAYERDCVVPNGTNRDRLTAEVLAARSDRVSVPPAAEPRPVPDLSVGWTHDPQPEGE